MCEEKKEAEAEAPWLGRCVRERRMASMVLDPSGLCEVLNEPGPWEIDVDYYDPELDRQQSTPSVFYACRAAVDHPDLLLTIVGPNLAPVPPGCALPSLGSIRFQRWTPPPPTIGEEAASPAVCGPEDLDREVKVYINAAVPSAEDMTTCPICGKPGVTRCRCPLSDRSCEDGHHWHLCVVHDRWVVGPSDHKAGPSVCQCHPHEGGAK